MVFTRQRLHTPRNISLHGYTIPIVNEYKYLGLILDTKLLWTKHINYIKGKCENRINMLRYISKSMLGADPKISLMFYRSEYALLWIMAVFYMDHPLIPIFCQSIEFNINQLESV